MKILQESPAFLRRGVKLAAAGETATIDRNGVEAATLRAAAGTDRALAHFLYARYPLRSKRAA
jgi:hypothetical protein